MSKKNITKYLSNTSVKKANTIQCNKNAVERNKNNSHPFENTIKFNIYDVSQNLIIHNFSDEKSKKNDP